MEPGGTSLAINMLLVTVPIQFRCTTLGSQTVHPLFYNGMILMRVDFDIFSRFGGCILDGFNKCMKI